MCRGVELGSWDVDEEIDSREASPGYTTSLESSKVARIPGLFRPSTMPVDSAFLCGIYSNQDLQGVNPLLIVKAAIEELYAHDFTD